jgi:hypothetical protein
LNLQDELNKLKNIEIKKLEQIIDQLENEKAYLIKRLEEQNKKIDEQNKKIDEQNKKIDEQNKKIDEHEIARLRDASNIASLNSRIDSLEENQKKIDDASLVSDLLYQLNRQFILKNKDDDLIKKFIEYKNDPFTGELEVHDINDKSFHRLMFKPVSTFKNQIIHIEKLFISCVNKQSMREKYSYNFNQNIHNTIIKERNGKCHSKVKDVSKYEKFDDFLEDAKNELNKMIYFKAEAQDVFTQLEILLKVVNLILKIQKVILNY